MAERSRRVKQRAHCGKSSCYQATTGHHALPELNPPPLRGGGGGGEKGKTGAMLHSSECGKSGRNELRIRKYGKTLTCFLQSISRVVITSVISGDIRPFLWISSIFFWVGTLHNKVASFPLRYFSSFQISLVLKHKHLQLQCA